MDENRKLPQKAADDILDCLRRGNTVEVKKVNGEIVVVEIKRQVKSKTQYA